MSAGLQAPNSRVARGARLRMIRRRRRAVVISVLLVATFAWVWHATQSRPQASVNSADHAPAADSSTSPGPTPQPTATAPPRASSSAQASRPTGKLEVVPGTGRVYGSGPLHHYSVEVEGGIVDDAEDFAEAVEHTLGDPRSWGHNGVMSFQRVSSGQVAFRVVLASPHLVDRLCAPLQTYGYLSCYSNGRSVVNVDRWEHAVPWYADDLAAYRQYVVNHEVGHALGHGHENCPRPGALAPVMQQQTKGMQGCLRNTWPY